MIQASTTSAAAADAAPASATPAGPATVPAASAGRAQGPGPLPPGLEYPTARPWIVAGLIIVLATLGGIVSWAALASVSGAVIGSGLVTVEGNVKTIQHLDGGIVADILVKNGDRVSEGDVLLRLDETAARANHGILSSRLDELYIQRARLEAEHTQAERVSLPATLSTAETEPRVAAFVASQRALFEARRQRRLGEEGLLRQQITQLDDQVKGLTAEHDAKKRQAVLIRREMESVKPLLEQGLYTLSKILALEREASRLDGEVGRLAGEIARTRNAMSETELKISQVNKEAMQQVFTELREAQGRIAELEEQRIAIEDKLRRIEIRAPKTGFVHNLAIHTVGGVVQPASPILEVIPEGDRLVIEARVAPGDIDQVQVGHPATIRVAAFNQRETPVLEGRVLKRSASSIVDRATGAPYFQVVVEIAPSELAKLGEGNTLIPGMQAEVFIETSARTVLTYFVKPLTDQLARAMRER